MKFPNFISPEIHQDDVEELIIVLEKSKKYLWDGVGYLDYRVDNRKQFICHAVEQLYESKDWNYSLSLGTVIRFIQGNIDNSVDETHYTFECWRETVHLKVNQGTPEYDQYVIDVQSHRKAWIDYLINNLKEKQNEVK